MIKPNWNDEQRAKAAASDLSELEIVEFMPKNMRVALSGVLGLKETSKPEEVMNALGRAGGYASANWWRAVSILDLSTYGSSKGIEYREVVTDLADKFGVTYRKNSHIAEIEQKIIAALIAKLPAEDREKIQQDIETVGKAEAEKFGVNWAPGLVAIGALSVAQLSGFGVYLFASTAASSIAGLVGATLPFAFYTGMSSLISIAIGPVGWAAAIGFLANEWFGPEPKKTLPCVLIIAAARGLLKAVALRELPPTPEPEPANNGLAKTLIGLVVSAGIAFAAYYLFFR